MIRHDVGTGRRPVDRDFEGLTAIVTGGASGIGAATVEQLIGRGEDLGGIVLLDGDRTTNARETGFSQRDRSVIHAR